MSETPVSISAPQVKSSSPCGAVGKVITLSVANHSVIETKEVSNSKVGVAYPEFQNFIESEPFSGSLIYQYLYMLKLSFARTEFLNNQESLQILQFMIILASCENDSIPSLKIKRFFQKEMDLSENVDIIGPSV